MMSDATDEPEDQLDELGADATQQLWDEEPEAREALLRGVRVAVSRNELGHFLDGRYALLVLCVGAPPWLQALITGCSYHHEDCKVSKFTQDQVLAWSRLWKDREIEWEPGCMNVVYFTESDVVHVPLETMDVWEMYHEGSN